MIQSIKNNIGKIVVTGAIATGGYFAKDQYYPRDYVAYDPVTYEVKEVVSHSKSSFESKGFQKPGLAYEERTYFYIESYDPNLLQKLITAAMNFLASCTPSNPPAEPPPGLPGQPVPPQPPPNTQDKVGWEFAKIKGAEANQVYDGRDELVAVIDTGVDVSHPDLQGIVLKYINLTSEGAQNDVTDFVGHGTFVTGQIAAKNDGQGTRGLSQARTIHCKGLTSQGGTNDVLANCIAWAVQNGAKHISMSWGGPQGSTLINGRLQQAVQAGVRVYMAAGNESSGVSWPAKVTPQLNQIKPNSSYAVMATDQNDRLTNFSNSGPEANISAPGLNDYSTLPMKGSQMGTAWGYSSGTSMSCPLVAAAGAMSRGKPIKGEGQTNRLNVYETVK